MSKAELFAFWPSNKSAWRWSAFFSSSLFYTDLTEFEVCCHTGKNVKNLFLELEELLDLEACSSLSLWLNSKKQKKKLRYIQLYHNYVTGVSGEDGFSADK